MRTSRQCCHTLNQQILCEAHICELGKNLEVGTEGT